jgi:acyl transferase domain-containing protein
MHQGQKNRRIAGHSTGDLPVVFMFSGQGAQYTGMGQGLHETQPIFRQILDQCNDILQPYLEVSLIEVLYSSIGNHQSTTINQTAITQPVLFTIEYALAQLWMSWGIRPHALIGHSVGEYVAACLAGVFSLEDALTLIVTRAKLMQQLPSGTMLSVPLSEHDVQPYLGPDLSLAAVNGPELCVVSGPDDAVEALEQQLREQGVEGIRLHMSHAFHSAMMEPMLETFRQQVDKVQLNPPQTAWASTVTGDWVTAGEVTEPDYWVRNVRETVRFADGITRILQEPDAILLEVGPGRTLHTLARKCLAAQQSLRHHLTFTSLRHPHDQRSDNAFILNTLGQIWLAGVHIDWTGFHAHQQRQRLPLPTYPFEHQSYWIESQPQEELNIRQHETPDSTEPQHSNRDPANANQLQQTLIEICRQVLGNNNIGIQDNFFDLGGDSLIVAQVISRINKVYEVELTPRTLFEKPTVAALAEHIETLRWAASERTETHVSGNYEEGEI